MMIVKRGAFCLPCLSACGGGKGEEAGGGGNSTGMAISGTVLAPGSNTVGMAGGEEAFTLGPSRYGAPVAQNGHFSLDFGGGLKDAPEWVATSAHELSTTIPSAAGKPTSRCVEYAKRYCEVYPGW